MSVAFAWVIEWLDDSGLARCIFRARGPATGYVIGKRPSESCAVFSNVSLAQLEIACGIYDVVSVENRYSLGDWEHGGLVDYCASEGVVFMPGRR